MSSISAPSFAAPGGGALSRLSVDGRYLSRRRFLRSAAQLGLTGSSLLLLGGCARPAGQPSSATTAARIGVLATTGTPNLPQFEALRQGLRELGYVEGQNLVFEYRFAQGRLDLLPQFAAELIALKVGVILSDGLEACEAARDATTTVPVVFGTGVDPVASRFATSLAHPGGHMTGVVHNPPGLNAKRLQILMDAVPSISRVGVLTNPANPNQAASLAEALIAGRALGVQVQPLEVRGPDEIDAAFEATGAERPDGLLALPDTLLSELQPEISGFVAKARLPAVFSDRKFAQTGGLLAYGADIRENFRRAAAYVDKILQGARPADLPIEQPARFNFIVNLQSAEALGLTLPQAVLEQATEVIA